MQDETPSRSLGEVVWDWLEGRNYWRLLLAVPALLAVAGGAAFAVYHVGWNSARAEAQCLETGGQSLATGQFQRAALAYQGWLRLRGQPEPDYLFRVARCFGELGRRPEAAAMLAALAPEDRPGHLQAHSFLARAIIETGGANPRALSLAETHLKQVLAQDTQNAEARELLGRIYLQQGRWDDARRYLVDVVAKRPDVALLLAVTQRELGDEAGSRAWAERAVKHFASRTEESVQEDPWTRLRWANALMMLKEYEKAADVIEAGRQRAGDAVYAAPLAQTCGQWAKHLAQEQPDDHVARVRALQRGLDAATYDPLLLRELGRFVRVTGAEAEARRGALTTLLAEGRPAPLLHLSLGCLAQQRGDTPRMDLHFAAAFAATPVACDLANNLAATLTEDAEGDPALALAIIQTLLVRQPENAFYRDTRGQVLLRQGKAEAAVADLEFALPKLPDTEGTHRALAQAYTRLGQTERAAEQTRAADAAKQARESAAQRPPGRRP